ncbi:MAG TPA: membrane protein insertase YidC [Pseudomonadales bacterium]|nr:membrane protein insertase YidC [Pseudomonadales bacterium]
MDFQRPVLLIAIAAISLTLLVRWHQFQETHTPVASAGQVSASDAPSLATTDSTADKTAADTGIPEVPGTAVVQKPAASDASGEKTIDVYTDVLHVKIDTRGGDIVMAGLRDYPAKIDTPNEPFVVLTRSADHLYVAQSGLIGDNGTDKGRERPLFSAEKTRYELADNGKDVTVDLQLSDSNNTYNNVKITKRYTFTRGDHLIKLDYLVDNNGAQNWNAHLYGQIKRDTHEPVSSGGIGIKPFLGSATTTSEKHFYKMTFKEMSKTPLKETVKGGWIAMVQHYFISAWIPNANDNNQFYTIHQESSDTYLLGFTGPQVDVAAGSKGVLSTQFYVGPKDVYRLRAITPYLDLTVDYGWLWPIAKALAWWTHKLHGFVGNWGFAIIGLTLSVKMLFLWPSTLSYKSMAVMKKLAPKMQEMKDAYGDNPNKLREEMFKLYKKENANPMLGCLPMIIQTPVFIALYWSLMESVDLRQAPFMGWIVDLSVQDPYFVMPVLMGISMWVQQKLNPPAADPTQQRVFQMMPVIFTGMFLFFPAGLVLYMLVNNIISMSHQYWIYKSLNKPQAAHN